MNEARNPRLKLRISRQWTASCPWCVGFAVLQLIGQRVEVGVFPGYDLLCVEAVVVWKLDRWGRSVAHCVRSIQELVSLGIRLHSPTEGIDTGTESPMSKVMLHLFAAFAEMEREIIRERVRAGVRNAQAKGTRLGAMWWSNGQGIYQFSSILASQSTLQVACVICRSSFFL